MMSCVFWFAGDYFGIHIHKRIYGIIGLFLLWVLKFLLIDLDQLSALRPREMELAKKLRLLKKRFYGVQRFLSKKSIHKFGKSIRLTQLPSYLLIGPTHAGKTTLLARSQINFILQRQFHHQTLEALQPSEHCDWWVTKDVSIIDVPGNYISLHHIHKDPSIKPPSLYPVLWKALLKIIKKFRRGVDGILIALPLPEIMKQHDPKQFQLLLKELLQRLNELKAVFPQSVPCYLIITKCDVLNGFEEFFAESDDEEISQAWGISLADTKNKKLSDEFIEQFNALIKKINGQLIWRLNQERNPMARPYIKDFPLELERIKAFVQEFIKKWLLNKPALRLQGIYLTSSIQRRPEPAKTTIEEENHQRVLQLFKPPRPSSRAYFIKQFLNKAFVVDKAEYPVVVRTFSWVKACALVLSVASIIGVGYLLGKDFEHGVNDAYSLQNYFTQYQLAIQKNQDPDEHLLQAIVLLDTLKKTAKYEGFKLDLDYLLSFYSHKAQQNAMFVYQQTLRSILLPEIKNYMEEYLKNPMNKDSEMIYAVLKSYLMMADAKNFQSDFFLATLRDILPKSLNKTAQAHLMEHLNTVFSIHRTPVAIDTNSINKTRQYLTSMSNIQLAYVILKNINSNNAAYEINLGVNNAKNPVFTSQQTISAIPHMFTGKAFATIFSQDAVVAAQEAAMGNWVLGIKPDTENNADLANSLIEQLRITYLNNYIDLWESLLANIHLQTPKDLAQTDALILNLTRADSPLLQLLQTFHDNTYFEPILSTSPKFQQLGQLVETRDPSTSQLYQVLTSLQSLHRFIQTIVTAENERKAAFNAVSYRMKHQETPDTILQLRLIADKCPAPLKKWLDKIANKTWHFLMQDAAKYIDTSWQEKVVKIYETDIADRYPFSNSTKQEVGLQQFANFFGKPGTITDFYTHYLQPFVDNTGTEWHWKTVDNMRLPLSDKILHDMQMAMQIHHIFFPNGDNKPFVQFALQPFKFGKGIKQVKLTINDKQVIDEKKKNASPHVIAWPNNVLLKKTSIQLVLQKPKKIIRREFPGAWGWFKLVKQSFVNDITTKQILIDLSVNKEPAKYIVYTEGQLNPFLAINLSDFSLPKKLS